MSSAQTFSLRWNDYGSYVAGVFESLRHEEDLVDVTLYCEGHKIRAHKVLLSACSSYFKNIFKENPCHHPIIIFENVKYLDLVSLLQFMYVGEVNIIQESLSSFLRTADLLKVRGLSDTPVAVQPISSPMQRTQQSRNEHSSTITTDSDYFASATAAPTDSQQLEMEPQTPVSRVIGTNQTMPKFANDQPAEGLDNLTVIHAPQQPEPNSTLRPIVEIPASYSDETALNSANIVSCTHEKTLSDQTASSQCSTALQEPAEKNVISTIGPVKIVQPISSLDSVETSSKQEANRNIMPSASDTSLDMISTTTPTTITTNREPSSNNESEMSGPALKFENVEGIFSENISLDKSFTTNSNLSGTIAQPTDFEMMCREITNPSESWPTPHQSNSLKMPNVDIIMENVASGEDGAPKESIMDGTLKSQQKKYQCTMCGKRFVALRSLIMHSETHTGRTILDGTLKLREKKHLCTVCGKRFTTGASLRRHNDTHTGRTRCPICSAVLSRIDDLKRHMNQRHGL